MFLLIFSNLSVIFVFFYQKLNYTYANVLIITAAVTNFESFLVSMVVQQLDCQCRTPQSVSYEFILPVIIIIIITHLNRHVSDNRYHS